MQPFKKGDKHIKMWPKLSSAAWNFSQLYLTYIEDFLMCWIVLNRLVKLESTLSERTTNKALS